MTTARPRHTARLRSPRAHAPAPRLATIGTVVLGAAALSALVACGADDPAADAAGEHVTSSAHTDTMPGADASPGARIDARMDTRPDGSAGGSIDAPPDADSNALTAVAGTTEIPYPVYPNGRKYRVGGENGLKIVVFQTEDSFDEVDAYYKSISAGEGIPRLMAMADYVRYPTSAGDADPWATHKPGIVIHEFDGNEARLAAGAPASARTNIIMSY